MPSATSQTISFDVARLDAARGQPPRAVDVRMRHGPARIGLEGERLDHPARRRNRRERAVIALGRVREAVEQPVHAFEHRARTGRSRRAPAARRACRTAPPSRRCSRLVQVPSARYSMMPPTPCCRRCRAHRRSAFASSPSAAANAGRRAHRAEHRGRMKAGLVHRLRHHGGQPAHHLDADRDAEQRGGAVAACAVRRPPAPPARSPRRHAPARLRTCRRNPRRAPRCR